MKILTIIGARPQFIKAATVSRVIKEHTDIIEIIVHTGQHFDANMSNVFFEEMNIPKPDYHLGIGGGNHGYQTGHMLIKIEEVLLQEKPDWVLVYGDTNSTLAGALAASKLHIPLAHVEAGLRSFNKKMPEEQNRILTDHLADVLFTPTADAIRNLEKEGISDLKIKMVGDVMYDAALYYGAISDEKGTVIQQEGLDGKEYVLCTIHRAENTDNDDRLTEIFDNLEALSKEQKVVLPLHPRTKEALKRIGFNFGKTNIRFIDPVGYIDMVELEKCAGLIITDSGGVQKEAYFHKVPCITLRNETEWVELVEKGYNDLIRDLGKLKEIAGKKIGFQIVQNEALYGKGNAANEIIETLTRIYSESSIFTSN